MPSLRVFLRFLFIVTFCLEGSVAMWATQASEPGSAAHVAVVEQALAGTIDRECPQAASMEDPGTAHADCDCAHGSACDCVFVFPAMSLAHAAGFAPPPSLPGVLVDTGGLPVVPAASTPVFRPPIG